MNEELELLSDGDGLAVLGSPSVVERFIASTGLADAGEFDVAAALSRGSSLAMAGSAVAAASGRWVMLTAESAEKVKQYGLTEAGKGVSHAMVSDGGKIKSWIQVVNSPTALLSNPAVLASMSALMSQQAMQKQMDEIKDYLAEIDQKLDAVLRSQMNQVLARLDGVGLAVREAMSIREEVGRVSDVTWSKVQSSAQTIHETQGFALRQLSDFVDKLEGKHKINELVDLTRSAETEVQKWLAVLARCFELHDAVALLELDRVLDAAPDDIARHRLGLRSARRDRLQLLEEITEHLLDRMSAAVGLANSKVLFNPMESPAVVRSSNTVAAEVHGFHGLVGIESAHESAESRRWSEAAADGLDKVRSTGGQGIDSAMRIGGGARDQGIDGAKRLGSVASDQANSVKGKLADRFGGRKLRRTESDE